MDAIRCGVQFIGKHGNVGANWPTMVLVCDDEGVLVAGRWAWVQRMLDFLAVNQGLGRYYEPIREPGWAITWSELREVRFSPETRSRISLMRADDDICQLWTLRADKLQAFVEELQRRDIPASTGSLPFGSRLFPWLRGNSLSD